MSHLTIQSFSEGIAEYVMDQFCNILRNHRVGYTMIRPEEDDRLNTFTVSCVWSKYDVIPTITGIMARDNVNVMFTCK